MVRHFVRHPVYLCRSCFIVFYISSILPRPVVQRSLKIFTFRRVSKMFSNPCPKTRKETDKIGEQAGEGRSDMSRTKTA